MDLRGMLSRARFYGAKSEPVDSVDVVSERPLGDARLLILRVNGRHLYQVLVDAEGADVLATSPHLYLSAFPDELPQDEDGAARAVAGEQSNTSLIVGDRMVKVFRHLQPGLNPDVELLSQIPDCPHIATVRSWITADIDGLPHTLAMSQDFVADADDGWRYALGFSTHGASFDAEASLLGEATREVHRALAQALPVEEVDVGEVTHRLKGSLESLVARAPVLAEFADAARDVYDALAGEPVLIQRIHGDLHLGQVLRGAEDYTLIDFEGEPARPLEERCRPDSPLRDVAGMLRSFDYAAHFPAHSGGTGPADPAAWTQAASRAFLAGYGVEESALLRAYILDKALYEVVYETDNRPDWVDIPLAAIRRILDTRPL